MNSKTKSKRPKTLKSYGENSIQRRTERKRQQKERKKAQSGNAIVEVDKLSKGDILDIIDRSHEAKTEERGVLVELDDDQVSVTSSVRSGPSSPCALSAKSPMALCPVCLKLYQKAKKMKAPLKDKLLDTNPKSLTCDQWVLLKPWSSKTRTENRRNLFRLSQLSCNLCVVKKSGSGMEQVGKEVCSRPHLFLQRNLQKCIRKPLKKEKKKNWKKRAREDCQGPRVAKQQRLLKNNQPQPISNGTLSSLDPVGSCCSTSSLESGEDCDLTLRLPSLSATYETDSLNICPQQSVPKRGAGFKELLAQLRGNNSMIVRESTTEVTPKTHLSFTRWKRS